MASVKKELQEGRRMGFITGTFIRVREYHKGLSKGQTMTEYALILAAIAIVVFVTYELMGQDITSLVDKIDTDLTNAS
jgi:Flp pilus assembly pilin Flp